MMVHKRDRSQGNGRDICDFIAGRSWPQVVFRLYFAICALVSVVEISYTYEK